MTFFLNVCLFSKRPFFILFLIIHSHLIHVFTLIPQNSFYFSVTPHHQPIFSPTFYFVSLLMWFVFCFFVALLSFFVSTEGFTNGAMLHSIYSRCASQDFTSNWMFRGRLAFTTHTIWWLSYLLVLCVHTVFSRLAMEGIKPLTMLVLLSRFTNWAIQEAFYLHGIIQKYSAARGSVLTRIPRLPY